MRRGREGYLQLLKCLLSLVSFFHLKSAKGLTGRSTVWFKKSINSGVVLTAINIPTSTQKVATPKIYNLLSQVLSNA
jgi:hypothetical protein